MKKFPLRSREMAHLLANRLVRIKHNSTRIDGCQCTGTPATGVRIKNKLGEERLTWDSFRELWLRNVECDENFVTKPQLMRRKEVSKCSQ